MPSRAASARSFPAGRLLAGAGVLMFVTAGLLLWRSQGGAVFHDLVQSAYAWCF